MSKWRKFLPLLIISCTVLAVTEVILYLLAYIELFTLFGGVLVLLLTIPLVYTILYIQTRYQRSKSVKLMNKIAFLGAGACLAFPITFFTIASILRVSGRPQLSYYIGSEMTIVVYLFIPLIVGAFIGYLIGRRRDYRRFM